MQEQHLWSRDEDAQLERFVSAIADDRLATALLSIDGACAKTHDRCQQLLDEWGRLLALRVTPGDHRRSAEELRRLLVRQLSFRGDVDDYYCPDNARLSQVIQRRRGMPILLSAVWIEVGRRAGVQMDGIGMPGHFIARVGGKSGLLVDPFSGGCRVTVKQCASIVGRLSNSTLPWSDEYLRPVSCDAIVERVLRNLLNAHRRREDVPSLFRVSRFHAELRPEDPEPRLLHACLAEQVGAYAFAASLYRRVIEEFAGSKESRVAARRYDRAILRAGRLH